MHPDIHINYIAILAAVVVNYIIGFLWYGPLFGKTWMAEMKIPADSKPAPGAMLRGSILMVIGSFLTAYVLAHDTQVWRASVWHAGEDMANWQYGFYAGFFVWLGFYVPMSLGGVAWENKSWKLFSLNVAYQFVSLQAVGAILANLR